MNIKDQDSEIWNAIDNEARRQEDVIELIASENIASKNVMAVQGSALTNKYAVGYPGERLYSGSQYIDVVENIAIKRAEKLFGAEHANVQPHSGSQANQAVYSAFLNPGDKILAMSEQAGGHFTHGDKTNFSGKLYESHSYGLDSKTELLDYDEIERIAKEVRPQLIVAGASAYSHIIDWQKFRDIADEVNAYLMVDMAHIAGLVAAGLHPSPVGIADAVTTTTHKTLRGPRGGMVLTSNKYADLIDQAVFPGTQSGALEHVIAGKAVAFKEALQPSFKEYSKQIIKNARAMAQVFKDNSSIRVVSDGTDNHVVTIDITNTGLTGRKLQDILESVNIMTNEQPLLTDDDSGITHGVRVGTATITSRDFKEEDSKKVANLILEVINNYNDRNALEQVKSSVNDLVKQHPITR